MPTSDPLHSILMGAAGLDFTALLALVFTLLRKPAIARQMGAADLKVLCRGGHWAAEPAFQGGICYRFFCLLSPTTQPCPWPKELFPWFSLFWIDVWELSSSWIMLTCARIISFDLVPGHFFRCQWCDSFVPRTRAPQLFSKPMDFAVFGYQRLCAFACPVLMCASDSVYE